MDKTTETHKKRLKGVVVSDKADKTVTVKVRRFTKHPKYGKFMTIDKKYKVHDENNAHKVGDEVVIESCKPVSKDKSFKVV
ncbi:30S ribosomal protein S17 [bacterium]|nr:30S ribosomal protein S17 [bacterium]|tara:strand:+ start:10301 stop:10543 length:243 start_codon:yes stop_codon:yes gene_type:complete